MPRYIVDQSGESRQIEVERTSTGLYEVTMEGRTVTVNACPVEDSVASFIIEGANHEVHYSQDRSALSLLIGGEHYELVARNRRERAAGAGIGVAAGRQIVQAPMPGRVVRVLVEVGETVESGQALLTLEAMKMENELRTPAEGTVTEVSAAEGQTVSTGDKLIVVE